MNAILNENIQKWLSLDINSSLKKETDALLSNTSTEELFDRFCIPIKFGTAGFRSLTGVGFSRLNEYTIKLVSESVFQLFKKKNELLTVVISYDSRHFSLEFAQKTAQIFLFHQCKVILFPEPTSTPILSFAIKYYKADIGVVITASHNPKNYNGFKLYNNSGGQILEKEAFSITENIKKITTIPNVQAISLKDIILPQKKLIESYYSKILNLLDLDLFKNHAKKITITYTPLYGTGFTPITHLLRKLNIPLHIVEKESSFDGSFPSLSAPNPELDEVFTESLKIASKTNSDFIIATDPDSDRIGIKIKTNSPSQEFTLLNGNEIGTIILYYLASQKKRSSFCNIVVSSVVTTSIVSSICKHFGLEHKKTLTGFKYIAQIAFQYPENFLFGFEESNGYLFKNITQDKDANSIACLFTEVALFCASQKISLFEYLESIYKQFGRYLSYTFSFSLKNKNSCENIMNFFYDASKTLFGFPIVKKKDFQKTLFSKDTTGIHPYFDNFEKTALVIFYLDNHIKISVRPSGTEPVIKFYIETHSFSETKHALQEKIDFFIENLKKISTY